MQTLFKQIKDENHPNILAANQVYNNIEDIKDKNPGFYTYLIKSKIVIKPDYFPFSLKGGSKGMLIDWGNKIMLTRAEEIYNQFIGNEREAGDHDEIFRDYKIANDNPETYIMLITNGCKLTPHQVDQLRTIRAVKNLGYGLPILPQDLIEDIKKIPSLCLVEYTTTIDYAGKDYSTAYLSFSNRQIAEDLALKEIIKDRIHELTGIIDEVECGMVRWQRIDENILPKELIVGTGLDESAKVLAKLICQDNSLKAVLHDLRSSALVHFSHAILVSLRYYITDISKYWTEQDIEDIEFMNLEDESKRNRILTAMIVAIFDEKESVKSAIDKIKQDKSLTRDEKYEQFVKLSKRYKALFHLEDHYSAYKNMFNLYVELRKPETVSTGPIEKQKIELLIKNLKYLFESSVRYLPISNEQKDIIKVKSREALKHFQSVSSPIIEEMVGTKVISPIYQEYEKYLELGQNINQSQENTTQFAASFINVDDLQSLNQHNGENRKTTSRMENFARALEREQNKEENMEKDETSPPNEINQRTAENHNIERN